MNTIKKIAARALCISAGAVFYAQSAWALLPIEHWREPSGAQVWLVQSPAIPMVDVQIDFDAGDRRDPAAQAGLAIAVADMAQFHAQYLQACRARVAIVGAVDRAQAQVLVGQLLARLPAPTAAQCAPLPPVPEVQPLAAPVQKDIPFASAQAHVLIGQPGFQRSDPDFLALLVGNHILGGGGFVSRLTNEVREKRGLSYSVYSHFSPGLNAGAFAIGLQTRPDQAAQAVQVARDVVARFVADGPTAAELRAAKDNLIGGFALRIDSNKKLLGNVVNIATHGLPLDYLEHWTERVQALTAADIRAAMQRKLQPERMVTVVLGAQP